MSSIANPENERKRSAILIIAGIFFLLLSSCGEGPDASTYAPQSNFVVNKVRGHIFHIPKGYVSSNGKSGANIYASLPDMKPYSRETVVAFNARGAVDIVGFVIVPLHATLPPEEHEARNKKLFAPESKVYETPYGIKMWKGKLGSEYFFTVEQGEFIFISCRQEGSVPFPRCSSTMPYKKDLLISYDYGRHNHLKNWREIKENLTHLVESFEVTSTPIKEE
ncbi:MAG: hypothetical protein GY862_12225 [Gammaproteobacteria bacterium]|nr:hypothetical protein [Gammaproteobacteria bacterium]